ncbi:MAG: hypothetical protein KKC05_01685 [Nanoarchaeota archaeon]|nr:hypothetical protein [Nanoarchaeota archaeon]
MVFMIDVPRNRFNPQTGRFDGKPQSKCFISTISAALPPFQQEDGSISLEAQGRDISMSEKTWKEILKKHLMTNHSRSLDFCFPLSVYLELEKFHSEISVIHKWCRFVSREDRIATYLGFPDAGPFSRLLHETQYSHVIYVYLVGHNIVARTSDITDLEQVKYIFCFIYETLSMDAIFDALMANRILAAQRMMEQQQNSEIADQLGKVLSVMTDAHNGYRGLRKSPTFGSAMDTVRETQARLRTQS